MATRLVVGILGPAAALVSRNDRRVASRLPMLNPRRLRLLVELADRGTISAVADALHFTPSTVSHGLSALEQEIGVPLLERSPRSVRLTPAAKTLVREGRSALAKLGAAEADAQAIGRLERGELALATFPTAGASVVADAIELLRERHPDLDLRLVDSEPEESVELLAAGTIDAAVVYDYPYVPPVERPGLTRTRLLDDPIRLCVPPTWSDGAGGRVACDDLRDAAFVAGRRGSLCYELTQAVCGRAGFEPRIAFETDAIAFTAALVNAGLGVAIMPELLINTSPEPIATRDLDPPVPPRRISAMHRSSADELAPVRAALAALTDAVTVRGERLVGRGVEA